MVEAAIKSDWRVEAIKDWAEKFGATELVTDYTEAQLLEMVYGVRSPEGAIKKFCLYAEVIRGEFEPAAEVTPREERPSKHNLYAIQDADEFIVEAELRGVQIKSCPECWMMYTPAGRCGCSEGDVELVTKMHHTPEKRV